MGTLQRTLKLRALLGRQHSLCGSFSSWAPTRRSSPSPRRGFQLGFFRAGSERLHTESDRPKPSPAAVPDRLPFSRITEDDLAFFRQILPGRVVTDPDLLESNNQDWLKSVRGADLNSSVFQLSQNSLVPLVDP